MRMIQMDVAMLDLKLSAMTGNARMTIVLSRAPINVPSTKMKSTTAWRESTASSGLALY
jgi:hypothetical protein